MANRGAVAAAVGLAMALLAAPVSADPPRWSHAGGNGRERHYDRGGDRHHGRDDDRRDARRAYERGYVNGSRNGTVYVDRRPNAVYVDRRPNAVYVDRGYRYDGGSYRSAPRYHNGRPIYVSRSNEYRWGPRGEIYCRRNDGSTGVIVGALAGGTLGNVLAGQGDKLVGSVLGGTLGAILGKEIDRGNARCR